LNKKEAFLNQVRQQLDNTALTLQSDLFEEVLSEIIPQLESVNGVLLDNAHNYQVISKIERVYDIFHDKVSSVILPQINEATSKIVNFSADYFALAVTDLPQRFERVVESTKTLIDLKVGLRQGKMIRGGLTDQMLNIDAQEFQVIIGRAVSGQMDMKRLILIIKDHIKGNDIKAGVYDRQIKRFAYDMYQQYDAAYNKKMADEFDMRYFVYQGGLVVDSRDFCAAHNNKVWSTEEAQEWPDWTPSKGEYPEGYEVKAKDMYKVPSYIDYPGYDPLIDRGGYNCRHIIGYISDDLAFKLRPGLKGKK